MELAVFGAAGRLGRMLVPLLQKRHRVRAFDRREDAGVAGADVLDPAALAAACAGAEGVIHLAQERWRDDRSVAENQTQILETRLKGTYNVMQAAREAAVGRVVQLSDLCVYDGYEPNLVVAEDFVPLPDTSAHGQAVYLSELIGREFARQHPGWVLTLRVGRVVDPAALPATASFAWEWVAAADVAAAVEAGLGAQRFDGFSHWGLYDVVAPVEGSRYDGRKLGAGQLQVWPREDFAAWRES